MRSGVNLLQKNEILFSGELAEAPVLGWGSCCPSVTGAVLG